MIGYGETGGETMSIHAEKPIRLNIEIPPAMHKHLKMVCVEDGESMHTFVIRALGKELNEREDRRDVEAFDTGMRDIAEHGTIPFDKAMEEIGL
jgi:hypothetical protein